MKKIGIILLVIFVLSACASNPPDVETSSLEPSSETSVESSSIVESSESDETIVESSDNETSDVESTESNEESYKEEESETSKPHYVISIPPDESEESSKSEASRDDEPEESSPEQEEIADVAFDVAVAALGVKTKANTSLVCYDPTTGADGGVSIITLVNEKERAVRNEYRWYKSSKAYQAAKNAMQNMTYDDANHLILLGSGDDELVGVPEENIYIVLGYLVLED